MAWSHEFRLTPVIQPSASNAVLKHSVLSVFINQRCAECVCLYYGLRVCGLKYSIIIRDRLRKWISTMTSSNEISWKLPPRNEELVAPLYANAVSISLLLLTLNVPLWRISDLNRHFFLIPLRWWIRQILLCL